MERAAIYAGSAPARDIRTWLIAGENVDDGISDAKVRSAAEGPFELAWPGC
jgi:hypothetical protein